MGEIKQQIQCVILCSLSASLSTNFRLSHQTVHADTRMYGHSNTDVVGILREVVNITSQFFGLALASVKGEESRKRPASEHG